MLRPALPRAATRGFTLIEMVIVLGVFAVIIAGLWFLVASVQENVRVSTADRQLKTVVANMRSLASRIASFTTSPSATAATQEMDALDVFPKEMRSSTNSDTLRNGQINHPWNNGSGGSVTVSLLGGGADRFTVLFAPISRKGCIDAAARFSGNEIMGLYDVQINGVQYSSTASGATGPLPIGVVTADIQCKYATGNSIAWSYSMR